MAHPDIVDYIVSVRVTVRYYDHPRLVKVCDSLEAAANYANTFLPADEDLRRIEFRVALNSEECDNAKFAYVFEPHEVVMVFKIEEMIECARQNLVYRGINNL
jgi:hypothetical protein